MLTAYYSLPYSQYSLLLAANCLLFALRTANDQLPITPLPILPLTPFTADSAEFHLQVIEDRVR